ncbi:MAG: hypothetical protein ABH835_00585 [Patescibacteria group bacterium]
MPSEKLEFIKNPKGIIGKVVCANPVIITNNLMDPLLKKGRAAYFTKCYSQKDLSPGTFIYFKNGEREIGKLDASSENIIQENSELAYNLNEVKILGVKPSKEDIKTFSSSVYPFNFTYNAMVYTVTEEKNTLRGTAQEVDQVKIEAESEIYCPETVIIYQSDNNLETELVEMDYRITGDRSKINVDGIEADMLKGILTQQGTPCEDDVIEVAFEKDGAVYVIKAFKDSEYLLNKIIENINF